MPDETPPPRVQFPGSPDDSRGDDLSKPVIDLLQNASLLATKEDLQAADGFGAVIKGPPQSVWVFEAGATALSKWWATALGGGAVATTIVAAIRGVFADSGDAPLRVAIVSSAAVLLSAIGLTIALIISSDVRGRAQATTVQIQARAHIITTFLALARTKSGDSFELKDAFLLAAALQPLQLTARLDSKETAQTIVGIRLDAAEGLQVQIGDDWVSANRINSFTT